MGDRDGRAGNISRSMEPFGDSSNGEKVTLFCFLLDLHCHYHQDALVPETLQLK